MSSSSTTISRTRSLRTKSAAAPSSSSTTTIPRKPTIPPPLQQQHQPADDDTAHIARAGSPSRLPTTRIGARHGSSASISTLTSSASSSTGAGSSTSTISSNPSTASSSSSSAGVAAASTRSKHPPLSGIGSLFGLGRSASTRHAKTQSMVLPAAGARQVSTSSSAAAEPVKRTMTTGRTLRSAGTDVAQGAAGGMAPPPSPATAASRQKSFGHLRAKSTAEGPATPRARSRPPSAESMRSMSGQPAAAAKAAVPRLRSLAAAAVRPKSMVARVGGTSDLDAFAAQYQQQQQQQQQQQPQHQQTLQRQPSKQMHRRNPSTAEPTTTTSGAMAAPPRQRPVSMAGPSAAAGGSKPTFNTFQKHYSPAKSTAPKPLTSSILAPPTPSKQPANVAASAETARLQTELLQLHLMHRDAGCVEAEWRASAHAALGRRFDVLAQRAVEVVEAETAVAEERNAAALVARCGGMTGIDDAMRLVEDILSGVWALGEPRTKESSGGRFSRVVRRFERWLANVGAIQARRAAGHLEDPASGDVVFVDGLDEAWRSECAGIACRLEGWRAALRDLGVESGAASSAGAGTSSIERVLAACRAQVVDMLAELDAMAAIERGVVAREDAWVRGMNAEHDGEMAGGAGGGRVPAGAIWRVV